MKNNNCVITYGGIIFAKKQICAGSELMYEYDMVHDRNYNWDDYKLLLVKRLPEWIQEEREVLMKDNAAKC
jgi:hypothetical protein